MKTQFTPKNIMALLAIIFCAGLSAQTVIKVGAGQGAKQTTIQLAYDSIVPKDITTSGAYVLEIQSDYDPTTEVYPITFIAKTGASAANNIVIIPAAGVNKTISHPSASKMFSGVAFDNGATTLTLPSVAGIEVGHSVWGIGFPANVTTSSYVTVTAVDAINNTITLSNATTSQQSSTTVFVGKIQTQTLLFNGAKYITIDGVSRTGNTGLTIQNPNLINCQTVMFTLGSQYNTLKNCYIKGANQSGQFNNGTSGQIYFNAGENDFNTVDNCDICDIDGLPMPICMVNMCNVTGSSNNDNTISNCKLYNIATEFSTNGNAGFFQFPSGNGTNTYNTFILNNRMYWTKSIVINLGIVGIGVGGSHNGLGNRFEGNIIGYGAADGTGTVNITARTAATALAFQGIVNAKNATVKNNIVGGINLTAKTFLGISTQAYSATSVVADDYFSGNQVKDISVTATATGATAVGLSVNTQSAFAANVKNNVVKNLSLIGAAGYTCVVTGMDVAGTPVVASAFTYTNNKVSNLLAGDEFSTAANTAYGIKINQGVVVVERNLIDNVVAVNSLTTAIVRGLQTAGSNVSGQVIKNNIISLGKDVLRDASISGIYQGAATTGGDVCKIYNNTVYIGGQSPATAIIPTYAYYRTGISQANDVQNNIFANARVIGNPDVASKESHYAMRIGVAADLTKSNYNIYQFGKNFGNVGVGSPLVATDAPDMGTWASNNNSDANSLVADPKFVNPTATIPDFNIQATSPAKGAGTNLSLTNDFNGFTRTTFDIGALAYGSFYNGVANLNDSKLSAYGINNAIVVNGMTGKTANIYAVSGQLVKSVMLNSDKESILVNKGFYIVKVASLSTKVLVK